VGRKLTAGRNICEEAVGGRRGQRKVPPAWKHLGLKKKTPELWGAERNHYLKEAGTNKKKGGAKKSVMGLKKKTEKEPEMGANLGKLS